MPSEKSTLSALIVSSSQKTTQYLTEMLRGVRFTSVSSVLNAGEAKRRFIDNPADVVIINSPLPDDFGVHLAMDLSYDQTVGILLLVKSDMYDEVTYKVENHGILTIARPCSRQTLHQTINLLTATQARIKTFESKAQSLKEKMDEIRLVNRAKWLLVAQLKMSEAEAHRYIEKNAMDACVKKREIAERIIKTYDR